MSGCRQPAQLVQPRQCAEVKHSCPVAAAGETQGGALFVEPFGLGDRLNRRKNPIDVCIRHDQLLLRAGEGTRTDQGGPERTLVETPLDDTETRMLVQPPGRLSASGPTLVVAVRHAASFTSVRNSCPRKPSSAMTSPSGSTTVWYLVGPDDTTNVDACTPFRNAVLDDVRLL